MPQIGKPERFYVSLAREADARHDCFGRQAAKVGQYVTLALNPTMPWEAKLRCYQHALKRHCVAPEIPDEAVWVFYQDLAHLVREHAGHTALQLAACEDETYAKRLRNGEPRSIIECDAERFFDRIIGSGARRPDWFTETDWEQLLVFRNQWI